MLCLPRNLEVKNRWKRLRMTPEFLLGICHLTGTFDSSGMPGDARLVSFFVDHAEGLLELIVESSTFPMVSYREMDELSVKFAQYFGPDANALREAAIAAKKVV